MTTAFLAALYVAPVLLIFAAMALAADWLDRRWP